MATTADASFLRAIIAEPDDDALRLIFADWLEEHGGQPERAEFIRLGIELANWPCDCDSEEERVYHDECRCGERSTLQRRLGTIHRQHARFWALPVASILYPDTKLLDEGTYSYHGNASGGHSHAQGAAYWDFHRGFVEELTLPSSLWLAHAERLVEAAPIRTVRLTTMPPTEEVWENRGLYHCLAGHPETTREERAFKMADALAVVWPGISFLLPS